MDTKYPNSRGKQLLSLALNQSLREKMNSIKNTTKKTRFETTTDPDYVEEAAESGSDTSTSQDESENSNSSIVSIIQTPNVVNEKDTDNQICTYIQSVLLENMVMKAVDIAEGKLYTKKGDRRKRRKYDSTPTERKKQKMQENARTHGVKKSCECKLQCKSKISLKRQCDINKQFWSLNKSEQKVFIYNSLKKFPKKRSTTKRNSTRAYSYDYFLKNESGDQVKVCKIFLLSTLGYQKENDRILKTVRKTSPQRITPKKDGRRHPSTKKIERIDIIDHINSFRPSISHYRREHAPNRKYLPSDVTITFMYKDFQRKFPSADFSYELYRKVVSDDLKISFSKLGHEECWDCEEFNIHKKSTGHRDGQNTEDCEVCKKWNFHISKANDARKEYRQDAERSNTDEDLFVSADLQKVIMLPRMETFKEIIFTPRIIAFNESFVPLGTKSKIHPLAIIWHEAISGRSKDDIISTYYAFFLANRDRKRITVWLDNCSSQNKNWTLFSFFIYIVNCADVAIEELTIKFFEPGHTFMSADSFHHQVEQSLKRKKNVYDFNDFSDAVQYNSKVNVMKMNLNNFFIFSDYTSKHKLQKASPKLYLKDMIAVHFKRGESFFYFKSKFSDPFVKVPDIFVQKYIKGQFLKPQQRTNARGVSLERKTQLISKLKDHVPLNRMNFWQELPVSSESGNLEFEDL